MVKVSKVNTKKKGKQNERQRQLTAERVKRFRAKMTEEEWEEKRRKDRERYRKKKEEHQIKSISELSKREQRRKRKNWRKNSKHYRAKKKAEAEAIENTPPDSDAEMNVPLVVSTQKKRGRKQVLKSRSKAYRKIKQQQNRISDLEKQLWKLKKRIERKEKQMKTDSPSPNSKVKDLVRRERVSPNIRKRLFATYVLEKQLSETRKINPKSKQAQISQKIIGSKILRKYRVQKCFSKNIVSYKSNKYNNDSNPLEYTRKPYVSKTARLKNELVTFFQDDMVSKMCPGKRDLVRKGKMKKQRRILLDTMKNLHKKFIEESNSTISFSTFSRARPFWVTRPSCKDRDTCACILHSNVDLLIFGLYTIKAVNVKNGKEALDKIVCNIKNDECMSGKCNNCKNKKVIYNDDIEENINVKFYQWRTVQEERYIQGNPKIVKRMGKEKQIKKLIELKEKLNSMLIKFKTHVYHMLHQSVQKKQLKNNLFGKELLLTIDFSENYLAKYKEEIQSMHFGASKQQISLHTSVLYYHNGDKVVPRSFCTVSNNLAHQAHAVWAHLDPILNQLSREFPQTKLFHVFSDSPSSQYRNRTNIWLFKTYLPNYFPLLEIATWNFSEPGHGKGAVDGVGGTLKRRADEKVLHGSDIRNASDFVQLFLNSKITVLEVSSTSIEKAKKELPSDIPQISNIMKMKQILYCVDKNIVFGRTLSCFKCVSEKPCSHYNLAKIYETQPKKPSQRLSVTDVWSSDEEGGSPTTSGTSGTQAHAVASSNTNINLAVDLNIGNYVLVQFTKNTKNNSNVRQFLAVVQGEVDESCEVKVMFLKSVNTDNILFYVDEKDVSYISISQIVAVLGQPTLVLKGDRIYYKFKNPIPVF